MTRKAYIIKYTESDRTLLSIAISSLSTYDFEQRNKQYKAKVLTEFMTGSDYIDIRYARIKFFFLNLQIGNFVNNEKDRSPFLGFTSLMIPKSESSKDCVIFHTDETEHSQLRNTEFSIYKNVDIFGCVEIEKLMQAKREQQKRKGN